MQISARAKYLFVTSLLISSQTAHAFFPFDLFQKKKEYQALDGQIAQLKKTLADDESKQNSLQEELKSSEISISEISRDIAELNKQLISEQNTILKLEDTQKTYSYELDSHHQALSQQVRIIYKLGQTHTLQTVLNLDDINSLNRQLYYYHYLTDARMELVTKIRNTLAMLNTNISITTQHKEKLKALLAQKQKQQSEKQIAQHKQTRILASLNHQSTSKQKQIENLIANRLALQKVLQELATQKVKLPSRPFKQINGQLNWPVNGEIVADFGSPLAARDHLLTGVIIKAPQGTAVHSVSAGKVIFANWLRGFGLLVIVNHGHGFMSLYARNKSIVTKVGDTIDANAIIAHVGNSGGYSESSLYFEIRKNGNPIDPKAWCKNHPRGLKMNYT